MATREQALSWVNRLHAELSNRRPDVEKAFKYFEGEQPLAYASDQWKAFHRDRYKGFSDNWCGVVGRVPVDRQEIVGFRLGGTTDVVSDDERQLWADWNANELAAQSNQGFLASTIAKRSAVLVWGDLNDEPVVSWEHPDQVAVAYSQDGRRRRLAAVKSWIEGDVEYATLYLAHEVWKFKRPAGVAVRDGRTEHGLHVRTINGDSNFGSAWEPREITGEVWPLPNPLGEVPVVEWLNRPLLSGEPISDIAGTIAMQDAINLLWAYLFTAADHASMPARVVMGAELPKVPVLDSNGQKVGERPVDIKDLAEGRMLWLTGQNAKIGQWDAAKLDVFMNVVKPAVGHVAAQTSTPGYYLLTNESFANLNGDALTAADVPLVDKVENQRLHFNPAAKETTRLMALVRGRGDLAAAIRATDGRQFVQWKNAAMHSPSQVADAATKDKSLGMSLRTILERRYGMTEPEIDREMERIAAERATLGADPTLERISRDLIDASELG